jgi:hypothetical protein
MLEAVDVGTQDLNLYERSAGAEAVAQLRELAAPQPLPWEAIGCAKC